MVDYLALDEDIIQDMMEAMGKGAFKAIDGQEEQSKQILHDFSVFVEKNEPEQIIRYAHILKASASQMGLRGIFLLAKELQEAAEESEKNEHISPRVKELVQKLQRSFPSALDRLKAYMAGEDISPNG